MASEVLCRHVLNRILDRGTVGVTCYRYLTSGEVATALRPFYFSVHPDLFGKFPTERATNENSLQVLSSYIQTLQQNRPPRPATLKFYLRPQGVTLDKDIKLVQKDLRKTVVSILSTCNLPTTYVDNIAPALNPSSSRYHMNEAFRQRVYYYEHDLRKEMGFQMEEEIEMAKGAETLLTWLSKNVDSAKEKLARCKPVREDVQRLQDSLCSDFGIKEVRWECGWNITHFRGCLQSFQTLAEHHMDAMSVLKGRTLVFGNDTGLSLEGHVLLNSGEVRNNWLDFIKNVVYKRDAALLTVPRFEKALSRVLRDIQVVKRKFQAKTMVNQYENNLRRLTTSLSDCQGRGGYPKHWPESLSDFELVVETEAGPLMLSPMGQFIVPCSCPSTLLVNFITDNMKEATRLLQQYKEQKQVEKDLYEQCLSDFKLIAFDKDDSITPDPMISCCKRLLGNRHHLKQHLSGVSLTITNYYSVMSDGQMCIPWNWKL
ncbi:T-cell activation inhibitor, mitochondrial isoform X2 [Cimex lectularius]|uniref:T-cell activation inhibitor, mitochondrial n=1 Tax=Cimex lectularius TaxID=79782 RepID=A0A8I6STF3_CIMLE|nr:T-cell activation inhibitor, mitochondrial isoform X2 [Cimex lectularius]